MALVVSLSLIGFRYLVVFGCLLCPWLYWVVIVCFGCMVFLLFLVFVSPLVVFDVYGCLWLYLVVLGCLLWFVRVL